MRERALAAIALTTIVVGASLWLAGAPDAAAWTWGAGAVVVLLPLVATTTRSLARGDLGVDAIALVAIIGRARPRRAVDRGDRRVDDGRRLGARSVGGERAQKDLRRLVEREPRIAHRYAEGRVDEVGVDQLQPGDVIVVRAGEIVPADGTVAGVSAVVDESTLTGEALPVTVDPGGSVRSGTANAGNAFDVRVRRPASESAYAAIVRLVRAAQSDRAPFTRMADRYASLFLPFALGVAGLAWIVSGDPVRALAVMVVATPCPLILAAPIAFVAGSLALRGPGSSSRERVHSSDSAAPGRCCWTRPAP